MSTGSRLVSVVIPAFNKPKYTSKTVDSVMAQTHRPIEIIISDDNSPKSLQDIIDGKKNKCDSRLSIKFFRQKVNLNYYWNLQFVLGKATGQYIVLLDHDDWLIDKNYFSDSIKAIEDQPNCYLSVANTFLEKSPQTIFNLSYDNWHYVNGAVFIKNYLFTTIHPSRSAVMLRFDKLKEIGYEKFIVEKKSAGIMKIMPDEAFVLVCLLAGVSDIAITGRVVSVRGLPPESLSRTALWHKSGGLKMFIPFFLLYQHFKKIGCHDGVQAMVHNLLLRYPCQTVNVEMIRYLNFNRLAIVFMTLGVLCFSVQCVISLPRKIFMIFKSIGIRIVKRCLLNR